jgi:hypothetical protein
MKKAIVILIMLCIPAWTFADVNYIDISKITDNNELVNTFAFIRGNKKCFDRIVTKWDCETPQDEMLIELHNFYNRLAALPAGNEELCLLIGDVSGYIYNINCEDTVYYDIAESYYRKAQALSPDDYRVYWFMGHFYCGVNQKPEAVSRFLEAEKHLPYEHPSAFWNDYAYSMYISNKPAHCIRAMDMVKFIDGKPGNFEQQYGSSVNKLIVPVDRDMSYSKDDIWSSVIERSGTFISRPLGIKILVDSTWKVSVKGYSNHQCGFGIYLTAIMSKDQRYFSPGIEIYMEPVNDDADLNDYINSETSKYRSVRQISYMNKYSNMVAYEIKDSSAYTDFGGAHYIIVGIERDAPRYPGLLLEDMVLSSDGSIGELPYYAIISQKDRFKGRIFYTIVLNTSEDVFDESYRIFRRIYDDRIIIE